MEKRYVSPKQLAEFLGIAIATVYGWICRKVIPYHKLGRLVRFDLREIEEWMKEKRVEEMD